MRGMDVDLRQGGGLTRASATNPGDESRAQGREGAGRGAERQPGRIGLVGGVGDANAPPAATVDDASAGSALIPVAAVTSAPIVEISSEKWQAAR